VKVLLRQKGSSLYYAGADEWTPDPRHARDFEEVDRAIQFHRAEGVAGVDVVLSYDDPACDLVLPLREPGLW